MMRCLCWTILFAILITSAPAEVKFVDVTAAAGISFQHIDGRTGEKFLIETLGPVPSFLTLMPIHISTSML